MDANVTGKSAANDRSYYFTRRERQPHQNSIDLFIFNKIYTMYLPKISTLIGILFSISCLAQDGNTITPDLTDLVKNKKITAFNRGVSILNDAQNKNGIHMDEKEGNGVAWLNGIQFSNGTIELDIKGRNVLQRSFVGFAFHGLNDSTMDAVYFRPFNFQLYNVQRKNHSVQYISLPVYDWQKLRTEFPNKYEHFIDPSPQPDSWFHVRIEIKTQQIKVYVNNNSNPSLVVDQITNRKDGMVGFWVGNNSDGDFANLKIVKE